jgi:hypothetical protein
MVPIVRPAVAALRAWAEDEMKLSAATGDPVEAGTPDASEEL